MIRAVAWKGRDGADDPARPSGPRGGGAPRVEAPEGALRLYGSQLNRIESTLNSLLTTVASCAAAPGSQPRGGKSYPSLGAAIAEIARRQKALDEEQPATSQASVRRQTVLGEAAGQRPAAPASLQDDIAALAAKLDEMRREQTARHAETPACNLDKLRTELANMTEALRDLGARGSVAALEQAIRGLGQKIEASRTEGIKEAMLRPVEQLVGELRLSLAEIDPRTTIKGLEGELKRLGVRLEDLGRSGLDPKAFQNIQQQTQEIRDLLKAAVARPLPVERIERQVAQLAESIDCQRAAGREHGPYGFDDDRMSKIEDRLDAIVAKVEEALADGRDQSRYEALSHRIDAVHRELAAREADRRPLEDLVRGLAQKFEMARESQAQPQAIEALERQIAELAQRLDRSNTGFSSLTTLEETIGNLFDELERTRQAAFEAAQNAARGALREPGAETSHALDIGQELQRLHAVQDEADRHTLATLNAVHETLEKVVGRLAVVEDELSLRAKQPGELLASGPAPLFAPREAGQPAKEDEPERQRGSGTARDNGNKGAMPAAAALEDFLIEPGSGFPGRREATNGAARQGRAQDQEAPATRSDFIAAARRAAQAAQTESEIAIAKSQARIAVAKPDKAGVLQQTRNFIAQHKRPVVLSLAALFVAIGAYAVIKTMGHTQRTDLSYNAAPAAPKPPPIIAQIVKPAQITTPAQITAAALDPTPMGMSAQQARPGVDPMPTGSIPRSKDAVAGEISQSDLEAAAQSGNTAAQFALATIYAEGRHVPRDFAAAAQWYTKAAAQGLAPAQYRLASFYEKGLGLPRDLVQARAWYQKAAEAGNVRAMHNLAVLAADGGDSDKPDYATAAQWFKKAAEYGVHDSQYNLAVLLARGLGVQQNFVSSYTWFAIAAAQGDTDAARKRDDVGARLTSNQLAAAKAMAASFRPKMPVAAANDVAPIASRNISPAAPRSRQRPKVSEL